jgi:hypothetical protein
MLIREGEIVFTADRGFLYFKLTKESYSNR